MYNFRLLVSNLALVFTLWFIRISVLGIFFSRTVILVFCFLLHFVYVCTQTKRSNCCKPFEKRRWQVYKQTENWKRTPGSLYCVFQYYSLILKIGGDSQFCWKLLEQRTLWIERNRNIRIKGQNNKLKKNVCVYFIRKKKKQELCTSSAQISLHLNQSLGSSKTSSLCSEKQGLDKMFKLRVKIVQASTCDIGR